MKVWDETAIAYNMLFYVFLKYGKGPQATHAFVEVKTLHIVVFSFYLELQFGNFWVGSITQGFRFIEKHWEVQTPNLGSIETQEHQRIQIINTLVCCVVLATVFE